MESILVYAPGKLVWREKEYRCATGSGGINTQKSEGDGVTPAGCFSLKEVLYRKDRVSELSTALPTHVIGEKDAWCNDLHDPNYNKHVELPYARSAELLWREDHRYDVVVVIGYNDSPVVPGKGSAIFIHVADDQYSPTDGCIALPLNDLLEILKGVEKDTLICIS